MKRCPYCELERGRHFCVVKDRIVDPDKDKDHTAALTGAGVGFLAGGPIGGIFGLLVGATLDDED